MPRKLREATGCGDLAGNAAPTALSAATHPCVRDMSAGTTNCRCMKRHESLSSITSSDVVDLDDHAFLGEAMAAFDEEVCTHAIRVLGMPLGRIDVGATCYADGLGRIATSKKPLDERIKMLELCMEAYRVHHHGLAESVGIRAHAVDELCMAQDCQMLTWLLQRDCVSRFGMASLAHFACQR